MKCEDLKSSFEDNPVDLPEDIRRHADECGDCKTLIEAEERLNSSMRRLPKVDSPGDFNSHVRARIASAENGSQGILDWGFLRYAVPALAMVFILGAVAVNSNLFDESGAGVPIVGVEKKPKFALEEVEQKKDTPEFVRVDVTKDGAPPGPAPISKEDKDLRLKVEKPRKPESEKPLRTVDRQGSEKVFSSDMTLEEPKLTTPAGLDGQEVSPSRQSSAVIKSFSDREILATLGVTTEWKGGKMMATSVLKNSIAGRAGVKTGDVIVSIDGRNVSGRPLGRATLSGKTIRVIRNGNSIDIDVRKK